MIAVSNIVDAVVALFCVLLAVLLLIHRALWPLLTRTLFRMTDIGTKGRRAILTAVGLALSSESVFGGKVPELLKDLVKILGGWMGYATVRQPNKGRNQRSQIYHRRFGSEANVVVPFN